MRGKNQNLELQSNSYTHVHPCSRKFLNFIRDDENMNNFVILGVLHFEETILDLVKARQRGLINLDDIWHDYNVN